MFQLSQSSFVPNFYIRNSQGDQWSESDLVISNLHNFYSGLFIKFMPLNFLFLSNFIRIATFLFWEPYHSGAFLLWVVHIFSNSGIWIQYSNFRVYPKVKRERFTIAQTIFIFILYKWKMKSLCRFAANRLSDTLTPFSRQTISHFRISSFQNSIESTYSFHSYFSVWISQSSFVPNFKKFPFWLSKYPVMSFPRLTNSIIA